MSRYKRRKYGNGVEITIEEDYSGLKSIYEAARKAHTKHIRFGWLNGKKYPSSHKNKGLYIAQVAEWQEYGTSTIPARPYAITNFLQMTTKALPDITEYFKAVCNGKYEVSHLNKIALAGKKNFSDLVISQGFKPLANSTIRIKGHDFQLDHTGHLLQNYDVKVYHRNINKIDVD